MRREKVVFVICRYGIDVNGGAEDQCRALAERLLPYYEIEVLTSCSRGFPWDNYYEEGVSVVNGVQVRRFPVEGSRSYESLEQLNADRLAGKEGAEEAWVREFGPFCPKLIQYLDENRNQYKIVVPFTYVFYPTVASLRLGLKNTLFVPHAHDQAYIYRPIFKEVFQGAKTILFNTPEEQELVYRLFDVGKKPYEMTCMGMDMPEYDSWEMPEKFAHYNNYVVYVGRVGYTKTFAELNKYFIEYKKKNPSDLKLLVIGRINNQYTITFHDDIEYLGFVSAEEKYKLIRNAKFLIQPSRNESLSIVLLESMALGRPVLANARCEVLKGQCIRSNAGLYYRSYAEFEMAIDYLLNNPKEYQTMCDNGKRFVRENYNWDKVIKNVVSLIERTGEGDRKS